MKRVFGTLLIVAFGIFLTYPIFVFSAEINSRCFTAEQCAKVNGDFEKHEECPGAFGRCYAKPPDIRLNVPIGNVATAKGLAHYIAVGYKYFIGVGIIIAVLMGSIGGFNWVASGGDSSRVGTAKKLITNASMGLVLLLGSYLILFTINPDILEFKLLRIAMIRRDVFGEDGMSCRAFDGLKLADTKLGEFGTLKPDQFALNGNSSYAGGPDCEREYYIENGEGMTCKGYACQTGYGCYKQKCEEAIIAGKIKGIGITAPVIDNDIALRALCGDGSIESVEEKDISEVEEVKGASKAGTEFDYIFSGVSRSDFKVDDYCDGEGGVRGFFIEAEVNDKGGLIGTPGVDDWHGIGRNIGEGKNGKCVLDLNLCKATPFENDDKTGDTTCWKDVMEFNDNVANKVKFVAGPHAGLGAGYLAINHDGSSFKPRSNEVANKGSGQAEYDGEGNSNHAIESADYDNSTLNLKTAGTVCQTRLCLHLIPEEWLFSGKTCDIFIDRTEFPDL